jgi:short-subunit dehydrogenase
MVPKKIIIVGASSGIGKEIALIYAKNGCRVAITGRRKNLLAELVSQFPENIIVSVYDVMQEHNEERIKELIRELGGLDLLIYNAGFGETSEALNWEIEKMTTKTNVNGFVETAVCVFDHFVRQGHGHLVAVSSVAALRGNSYAPSYSASKAFIINYMEGLRLKAWRLKVDITLTDIRPGFIDTKLAKANKRFWMALPQKAASRIIEAIEKKKRVAYITKRWWLIAVLLRIIPYSLYKRLA